MLYTYRYHPVMCMSFRQIGDSSNYFPGSQEHVTDEMTRDAAFELVDEAIELVIQCPAIHRESMGRAQDSDGFHGEYGDIVGMEIGISWVWRIDFLMLHRLKGGLGSDLKGCFSDFVCWQDVESWDQVAHRLVNSSSWRMLLLDWDGSDISDGPTNQKVMWKSCGNGKLGPKKTAPEPARFCGEKKRSLALFKNHETIGWFVFSQWRLWISQQGTLWWTNIAMENGHL